MFFSYCVFAQKSLSETKAAEIAQYIQTFKQDSRGPYKDIRWFCPNGSFLPPGETCPDSAGIQRARYKDWVVDLAEKNNVYLGQILAGTEFEDFLDKSNSFSRMRQYCLEKFLFNADNGWIQQKSQFYRGAMQDEDESAWGAEFLVWYIKNSKQTENNFLFDRELFKQLTHKKETSLIQEIRAVSKVLADRKSDFMPIRIRIHGSPSIDDLRQCEKYKEEKSSSLKEQDLADLNRLIEALKKYYNTTYNDIFKDRMSIFTKDGDLRNELEYFASIADKISGEELVSRSAEILTLVKEKYLSSLSAKAKYNLMDISVELESKLLTDISGWKNATVSDMLEKACLLSQMSSATGYIFDWELEELYKIYSSLDTEQLTYADVYNYQKNLKKNVYWGTALITEEFHKDIDLFSKFEPLVHGFIDDRIRSSLILPMGMLAADMHDFVNEKANFKNQLFGKNSGEITGVNPGYVKAKLKVVDKIDEDDFEAGAIYAFQNPPSDLLPVAGILSISEGNLVSHIQLLARNLGIPNAIITNDVFNKLKKHDGEEVFYAVSPKGGVVIKLAEDMNREEKALVKQIVIDESVVHVPVDKLQLDANRVFKISEVDASSSGVLCGPKAANFGKLKKLFPENLVNGMVVPFAVFKDHMDQTIPGTENSYWDFLNQTFEAANAMKEDDKDEGEITAFCIERLKQLSDLILQMPLKAALVDQLDSLFQTELDSKLGQIPVFLRSDTNMEDLKDFTGAGLNLTLFNLISKDKILNGIKQVWASPYTERSYKWRQRFLSNPLDVYPSILIIPSVFVDKSGVIISKDLNGDHERALSVAFSQGVGGAVDGQKSESWILKPNGQNILISPSRDKTYKYLSKAGAMEYGNTKLDNPLLTNRDIKDIWKMYETIHNQMPSSGMSAPYDIEMGFVDDKLYLFQIRPFVENKKAGSSSYLLSLDPVIPYKLNIKTDERNQ